ncbi:MAG TPA: MFS transporter, partial [Verrucomicrobiales bacterium]|nr:MFS transporter [Verrucomicrobiales bacterium]
MSSTTPARTSHIFFWSLVSALAGFLFGFDTVVISGAEKTIQSLWGLSDGMHGIAMASALYGTVIGSLCGGWPTDRWGRKKTLISAGVLYLASALWSGLAPEVWSLIVARFIGGLGVGISTVAAPLYIAEISPPERRGRLAGMFQFNIVFGILVAFLSNYLLGGIGAEAWRWMLGVEAVPALIYMLMCFTLPESPRWLLTRKKDRAQGLAVLRLIDPQAGAAEIEERADQIVNAAEQSAGLSRGFWSQRLRKPIVLAFLVAFFNQLSGINAVLYYTPSIFKMAGAGVDSAMLQSVIVGATMFAFTIIAMLIIDHV